MKYILVLALVASPAFADVYRCNSGNKTIYQDAPCPNAKVVDNFNALAPSPKEQTSATERATRERALVERLNKAQAAEGSTVTVIHETVGPMPVTHTNTSNRPDRYYDRPDSFNSRTVSGPMR